ncbi:hypothetical protein [Corynebacterium liangguodongii]|uniref:DUF7426 domain-containing protein n=1 Tax=Corynebacterium liangguodongii TaxID=2079535 RepID=A0A2S0WGC7_9CORY|nr:hypothetical protein [Corynebacterium liangguodongii]AWB84774.1 hypothetical protein C3E79_10070 [Corynebacterium liangguodongii]PWB99132.1 hypothetical protein DF219_07685 [Corynebacterium liangguodongii]
MKDLRQFHDPDLHLPIGGKVYTVHAPNAQDGLRLKAYVLAPESADMTVTGKANIDMISIVLGATYDPATDTMTGGLWDELVADGIPLEEVYHVANTAIAHFAVGEAFGEFWWENRLGKETQPLVPEATMGWMEQTAQAVEKKPSPAMMPKKRTS